MAVLVEAISLIVRVDAIRERFPGGWEAFRDAIPNNTLCIDDELARVGFMTPDDVESFVHFLEARGLTYIDNGAPRDMVAVDQLRGPAVECDWVDFGHVNLDGDSSKRVAACQLKDGVGATKIWTPDGWNWEQSLTRQFGFIPLGKEDASLVFLRREGGLDVFLNKLTGNEVFVGRTLPRRGQ